MKRLLLILFWCVAALDAAQHSGSVRAADQFIPGAAVTARQGEAKVVAYTDENGRYTMDLTPGVWELQVDMLGFVPAKGSVTVTGESAFKEWALDMPRLDDPPATAAAAAAATPGAKPAATPEMKADAKTEAKAEAKPEVKPAESAEAKAAAPAKPEAAKPAANAAETATQSRGARSGQRQNPTIRNATARATDEGRQALSASGSEPAAESGPGSASESEDAFVMNGSTSGGLAASSDEEERRQRMAGRGSNQGGPGGPGGPGDMPGAAAMGIPPGMAGSGDSLGLGGFGASGISGGFGLGSSGDPSASGPGGGRGGPGGGGGFGGGGGGFGGGGSYGGGGRGGPGGVRGRGNTSGPGGQYASFGNRRRSQPAYTGSLYFTANNSALDAAPYSLNGRASTKASYARNRFGISAGGPLAIPKLFTWTRSSVFFSYSGSRARNPYNQLSSLPTEAERNGDFSQARSNTSVTIFDPLNGVPFANNQIPLARFDPAAKGLLKYFPLPTYTGLVQNYRLNRSLPNNSNSYSVRLNAPLSRKDRLTFNVQDSSSHSQSNTLFGFTDSQNGNGMSSSAGWSHSFAPRVNNSANFSLSRNNNKGQPYFAYRTNVAALLGITGTSQDPINYGPPNISFTNFGGLSDGSASVSRNQTTSFSDNMTIVLKRRNNITFGVSYRRMQQNSMTYQNARGAFSFSGLLTSALDAQGHPIANTGFDFADFLLGLPQSSSLRYGSDNNYFRGQATNTYVQNDLRLSRRLSINAGLRYEYFTPYTELHGHLANLDISPDFRNVAVVTPGTKAPYSGVLPDSLVRADRNNLSPRFGFAWRPGSKRSAVVRGGYSIFFSGSSYSQLANQMASQPPFARTMSISTSTSQPLSLQNGFPIQPVQNITNSFSVDPDYKLAYAQTWVVAVQNSLPLALLVEIEYIGTKGTNLGIVDQPNRAAPGAAQLNAQSSLPIPYATGFSYQSSHANSSYNAGQIRLTRRFTRGMSATALYIFSKAIDNASNYNGMGGTIVQFIDNLRLERGPSTFDQRHRLQTTFMLSSPVGVHGIFRNGGWKTKLLTNWALLGNFNATTGTPLTARVAGNLSNTGGGAAFGTGRAQATGLDINDGDNPYFNLAAFTTPLPGQYGNAGRSTIPGPLVTSLSSSLNRAFRLGDGRRTMQLRISASNVLNHPTITGFGTTVNSATYGLPTSASAARSANVMLRFSF